VNPLLTKSRQRLCAITAKKGHIALNCAMKAVDLKKKELTIMARHP